MGINLKNSLAAAEFRRRGSFTQAGIKIRIGEDVKFRETKRRLAQDNEKIFIAKNGGESAPESGLFMNGREDMAKKVRMPKNRTGDKMRKKESSDARNHYDGIQAGRAALNSQWEKWCQKYGAIEFYRFQKEIMVRRVYAKKLAAL